MTLRQSFFDDDEASAAYRVLIKRVFSVDPAPAEHPRWIPFAYFDEAGRCVASLETTVLSMVCDSAGTTATGIRLVATDPSWRGRGLFRALMERALARCAAVSGGPCLLYTADFDLYRRFGFVPLAQHAFVGAVRPSTATAVRAIDMTRPDDRTLVEGLLATRASVSDCCAVVAAPSLFMSVVAGADDLTLSYDAQNGLLVVHENEDEGVTLVDVVAARIPPLAVIVGAVGGCPGGRLKTLFPPDRLDWLARPVPDETGLMARGILPPAMMRPFRLPPTTEF